MSNSNENPFTTTFHSVLLAPDLCNRLFLDILVLNLGQTCLFHKGFCTMYFNNKTKNAGYPYT